MSNVIAFPKDRVKKTDLQRQKDASVLQFLKPCSDYTGIPTSELLGPAVWFQWYTGFMKSDDYLY